jgi:membrane fusion protein (multidrug efflux system)
MADDSGFRPTPGGAAEEVTQPASAPAPDLRARQFRLRLIMGSMAAVLHWRIEGRFIETTDNAFVRADISTIAAKVSGYVEAVAVNDNQTVAAGDVLVQLDDADFVAAVARARAELARAQAELSAIAAQRALARADAERYRPLAERGLLSQAGMQQFDARAAQMGGSTSAAAAAVEAARAALAEAELNLSRTVIRAPIAGVVGDRQVRVGQFVQPGAPMMAIVPLDALYVIANFKETQVADIRAGQPAIVKPDVDGGLKLEGVVDSLAPASGAEFSIIPMDTATGNFTKIVQRVPVRIRFAASRDVMNAARLRPGLSATVSVDTRP